MKRTLLMGALAVPILGLTMTLAAPAANAAAPRAPALQSEQAASVQQVRHVDRGRHYGWNRGHRYGWRHGHGHHR